MIEAKKPGLNFFDPFSQMTLQLFLLEGFNEQKTTFGILSDGYRFLFVVKTKISICVPNCTEYLDDKVSLHKIVKIISIFLRDSKWHDYFGSL